VYTTSQELLMENPGDLPQNCCIHTKSYGKFIVCQLYFIQLHDFFVLF